MIDEKDITENEDLDESSEEVSEDADLTSSSDDGDDEEPITYSDQDREAAAGIREMISYVARTLADEPDNVNVAENYESDRIVFVLDVAEVDKGRVIGRNGRIAEAVRSIMKVAAVKAGLRVRLEIS